MKTYNKVIIPSAKFVPEELWKIGKLPGVVFPINDKIVFDYLYEQYEEYCDSIDVVCFEKANEVANCLKKYEDDKIRLLELPELSDLGNSIYYALDDVSGTIVINFADTIVMDKTNKIPRNVFFYSEDYVSDTWTFYDLEDGVITEIYDKNKTNSNVKKKLFVGVFIIEDSIHFKKCLEDAFKENVKNLSTFYRALQLYSYKYPMTDVLSEEWFDVGHAEKYYNSRMEVKAREFNHISIDRERGILRKTSENKDKFIGEIEWYLKLPSEIEYVRPRIFSYSVDINKPYISMEYYAYHTIHEMFLYGELNRHQWGEVFRRIRFVYNDFNRFVKKDKMINSALEEMYLSKTLQRMDELKKDINFKNFFESSIFVNGTRYCSLQDIILKLQRIIPEMLYGVEEFHIIHGDFCFSNIMIDENCSFIKVIDPRGKFGEFDIYGDNRYELAKLFHSIDGKYDFIIKDLFEVKYDLQNTKIEYDILDRQRDFDIYQVFLDVFNDEIGNRKKEIELIESLLFLSMIPLHKESLEHQIVMLATGIEILNRVVNIEEPN